MMGSQAFQTDDDRYSAKHGDNTPDVSGELRFIRKITTTRVPRVYKTASQKIVLCVPMARVILIVDEHNQKLAKLLRGFIVTKNAGVTGKLSNIILRKCLSIATRLPRSLLKTIGFDTPYQLLTWRKGMRYRFVDLDDMTMLDWAVPGGEPFIRREIRVRLKNASGLHVSPMLEHSDDGTYFRQSVMDAGSLLAQQLNAAQIDVTLDSVFRDLAKLYNATRQSMRADEYVANLTEAIAMAAEIPNDVRERTKRLSKFALDPPRSVHLARIHGDLNLGNVLLERATNTPYLIDWEASDTYSLLHDVFNLQLFVGKIHKRPSLRTRRYFELDCFAAVPVLNDDKLFRFYHALFFMERILMWSRHPGRNERWLMTLDRMATTEFS